MAGELAYREFTVSVHAMTPPIAPAECISALSQVMAMYAPSLTIQEQNAVAEWFRSTYSNRE